MRNNLISQSNSGLAACHDAAAFTLAEVLITIAVIGIVAAITIPALITGIRSAQYKSRFRKGVSTLSQAARMSKAMYGFDYAGINTRCGDNPAEENPEEIMSVCALLNGTLTGITYMKYRDVKRVSKGQSAAYDIESDWLQANSTLSAQSHIYLLSDGSIVGLNANIGNNGCYLGTGDSLSYSYTDTDNNTSLAYCTGWIDVNGTSLPNKEVSCSQGSNKLYNNDCVVKNDAAHMTDIYPIRFHDGIVEGGTASARYVLKTAK